MKNKMQRFRKIGDGSMTRGGGGSRQEAAVEQVGGIRNQWTRGNTRVVAVVSFWLYVEKH